MTKAPKCRFCNQVHYGNCVADRERTVTTSRLAQLEAVIERGKKAMLDAGRALAEVRDLRLYREDGHKTFDEYCVARWGFSAGQARRIIDAGVVVEMLPLGPKPTTERAARPLVEVLKKEGPEAVREVWAEAGDKPTAADVRAVVQRRAGEPECQHHRIKCADCGEALP